MCSTLPVWTKCLVDDGLVYQAATVGAKQVEREPASADTFGLLTD